MGATYQRASAQVNWLSGAGYSARAPDCTQHGHHEHHACTKCGFAWIGEPPVSEMDDEGWEEVILAAFDQIIGHRLRKSNYPSHAIPAGL